MSAQLLDHQGKDGKSYGAVAISSPRVDLNSKELSWQPSIRDLPAARPTRTNSCDNAGKAFTASGMPPVTPAAASPQRIPRVGVFVSMFFLCCRSPPFALIRYHINPLSISKLVDGALKRRTDDPYRRTLSLLYPLLRLTALGSLFVLSRAS